MKRYILTAFALLVSAAVWAGDGKGPIKKFLVDRFSDPDEEKTVFVPKGNMALGISGGYRSLNVGGEDIANQDGYAILSLLNIGNGKLQMYNVSPGISYFLADDLSLGVDFDYSGYYVDTDLNLRILETNFNLTRRHMVRNAFGGSLVLRKYVSFFGSKLLGIFGEARLYGNYGKLESCPIDENDVYQLDKMRTSNVYSAGLKVGGGVAVHLQDNSLLTISIPLFGANYNYTRQEKANTNNKANMSLFNLSRETDLLGIKIGYVRYFSVKKK